METAARQSLPAQGREVGCRIQSVTERGCDPTHTHSALFLGTSLTGESNGWSCQTCSGTRAGGTCLPSRSGLGPGLPNSALLPIFSSQKYIQWLRV